MRDKTCIIVVTESYNYAKEEMRRHGIMRGQWVHASDPHCVRGWYDSHFIVIGRGSSQTKYIIDTLKMQRCRQIEVGEISKLFQGRLQAAPIQFNFGIRVHQVVYSATDNSVITGAYVSWPERTSVVSEAALDFAKEIEKAVVEAARLDREAGL